MEDTAPQPLATPMSSAPPPFSRSLLALRILAIAVALYGAWVSSDLLNLSVGKEASNPLLARYCGGDPNQISPCEQVLQTEAARVRLPDFLQAPQQRPFSASASAPGGVAASAPASQPAEQPIAAVGPPWAAVGMGYFFFLALWYLFVGSASRSDWGWQVVILLIVAAGAANSARMLNVMRGELHQWCAGCVMAHVLNFGLALITVLMSVMKNPRPGPRPALALATLTAGGLAFVVVIQSSSLSSTMNGLIVVSNAYKSIVNDPHYAIWKFAREPVKKIPLRADDVFLGAADAPNTVVAFTDLQCPRCGFAFVVLNEVLNRFPGQVRIVYRHYPLDALCNHGRIKTTHQYACEAARSVEAARVVGGAEGYKKMRHTTYYKQRELEKAPYLQWAGEIGLDTGAFEAARRSPQVEQRIQEDIALANDLGIDSVPTIFFNGKKVESWESIAAWQSMIEAPAYRPSAASGPSIVAPRP